MHSVKRNEPVKREQVGIVSITMASPFPCSVNSSQLILTRGYYVVSTKAETVTVKPTLALACCHL